MRTKNIHLVVQWDIHIPTCKEYGTEDPYYEYQIGTNPRLHYVDYSQIQWVENDKADTSVTVTRIIDFVSTD